MDIVSLRRCPEWKLHAGHLIHTGLSNGTFTNQQILSRLEVAYNNAGMPEVWTVAKNWLRSKGIE